MPQRLRKIIGIVILLLWLLVYAIFAWGLAVRVLPGAHGLVEFLYYAVAGLAWIVPVRFLMLWMNRPDPAR